MTKHNRKALFLLQLLLMVYSLSTLCSKMAAGVPFLSIKFCFYYGMLFLFLGIYAIGWQQVIKYLPLTTAYASKAVTVVWGIIWGAVFFHEQISPGKLLGAAIVIAGVVLYVLSDRQEEPHDT